MVYFNFKQYYDNIVVWGDYMNKSGLITGIIAFVLSFVPPLGIILGLLGAVLCSETEQYKGKLAMTFNIAAMVSSVVMLYTGKIYFSAILDIFV